MDYLSAYRWLCTRSLLEETFDHVASCWRMSNSTVGMLEYCNVLNKSLQELILYAMESPYDEDKSPLKSVSLGQLNILTRTCITRPVPLYSCAWFYTQEGDEGYSSVSCCYLYNLFPLYPIARCSSRRCRGACHCII